MDSWPVQTVRLLARDWGLEFGKRITCWLLFQEKWRQPYAHRMLSDEFHQLNQENQAKSHRPKQSKRLQTLDHPPKMPPKFNRQRKRNHNVDPSEWEKETSLRSLKEAKELGKCLQTKTYNVEADELEHKIVEASAISSVCAVLIGPAGSLRFVWLLLGGIIRNHNNTRYIIIIHLFFLVL